MRTNSIERPILLLPTGWLKSKPLPIYKKSYKIVLKPSSDSRFLSHIKVSVKHNNVIR